jgi:hypothetical protein
MRLPHVTIALSVVGATFVSAAQARFNPNAPTVPSWTHTVKLPAPDGRVFVTDGRLTVDLQIGKPAIRPSTVMAPDTTRAIANYLLAPYPTEFGLNDLKPSESGNTFSGPSGVVLSTYYVTFLRREAPRARLRVRGQYDPLLIVLDGRPVGLLMPGA